MLLIIDNNEKIRNYFTCENEFLDASNITLEETLEEMREYSNVERIYFPLELKFKNKYRQHFEGLELLKHIRLTPELGEEIQYAPILLGYTYPLETILRNPESTILSAPATYLYNLKNIYQINNSNFFRSDEKLTKNKLKPYILYTDTDEAKSEHDRRNEQGALKLERELNGASNSDIGLDLWQKKLLFLQTETKASEQTSVSDADFKATIKGKRILYLDDEADKWEKALKKLFDGATVDVKNEYKSILKYFDNLFNQQQTKLKEFTPLDKKAQDEYKKDKDSQDFKNAEKSVQNLQNALFGLFPYDIVLLDMRLQRVEDKDKSVAESSGFLLLNTIKQINPFIPVIIFTASNKILSYRTFNENGANGFWIKNVSSADDLKKISYQLLNHELTGGRNNKYLRKFYYKMEITKLKNEIVSYSKFRNNKIESGVISQHKRSMIYDCYPTFISTIHKLSSGTLTNIDIAILWRTTGISMEIRLPVAYDKSYTEDDRYKKIYPNIKDNRDEKFYREVRNYFLHEDKKRKDDYYSYKMTIDYIEHTINFLLDYR